MSASSRRPTVAPAAAVRDGHLREDLYYRLNVFEMTLPPLRERRGDLPLLRSISSGCSTGSTGSQVEGIRKSDASSSSSRYPWPGNVRELRNVIERAVIVAQSGWIEPSHLPPYLQALEPGGHRPVIVLPLGTTVAEAEKALILQTLEHVGQQQGGGGPAARTRREDDPEQAELLRAGGRPAMKVATKLAGRLRRTWPRSSSACSCTTSA